MLHYALNNTAFNFIYLCTPWPGLFDGFSCQPNLTCAYTIPAMLFRRGVIFGGDVGVPYQKLDFSPCSNLLEARFMSPNQPVRPRKRGKNEDIDRIVSDSQMDRKKHTELYSQMCTVCVCVYKETISTIGCLYVVIHDYQTILKGL